MSLLVNLEDICINSAPVFDATLYKPPHENHMCKVFSYKDNTSYELDSYISMQKLIWIYKY